MAESKPMVDCARCVRLTGKGQKEHILVKEIVFILMVVVVSQVFIFLNSWENVHLKWAHFIVFISQLNKTKLDPLSFKLLPNFIELFYPFLLNEDNTICKAPPLL